MQQELESAVNSLFIAIGHLKENGTINTVKEYITRITAPLYSSERHELKGYKQNGQEYHK